MWAQNNGFQGTVSWHEEKSWASFSYYLNTLGASERVK